MLYVLKTGHHKEYVAKNIGSSSEFLIFLLLNILHLDKRRKSKSVLLGHNWLIDYLYITNYFFLNRSVAAEDNMAKYPAADLKLWNDVKEFFHNDSKDMFMNVIKMLIIHFCPVFLE